MKFDVQPPIIEATNSSNKRIVCAQWSPDSERLAVATTDRIISVFTINSNESTRFSVKARDENESRNFTITGLSWAPDCCRFAVSQSDMLVAVYDIGPASSVKSNKKITIRFTHKSSILCIIWPFSSSNAFVYGLSDGSVLTGLTNLKKTEQLYKHTAPPLSLSSSLTERSVVVGHADGNIFVVNLDSRRVSNVIQTSVPPQALAWGSQILASGSDLQLCFVDPNGSGLNHVDYSNQSYLKSFTCAAFDPSGSIALVAGRNVLLTLNYSTTTQSWAEQSKIEFDGLYSVTSLSWSPDGSKIAVGSVTGAVFIINASKGSYRYKKLFEVVQVNGSQINIISLKFQKSLTLKSQYQIMDTHFYQDQYIVSRTTQSFLIGDILSGKTVEFPVEIMSQPKITEKFIFIDDLAVIMWNKGELTVVEFGKNEPIANIATNFPSSYLLSLRLDAKYINGISKILSYLIDSKTIRIVNLETLMPIATLQIDSKVDWIELNVSGTFLLYRDSNRSLYLYNLITKENSFLIPFCSYAQWVPDANVIVAQSKKMLYVWYSPNSPDQVQIHEINGDVNDIKRNDTKTTVSISHNGKQRDYPLDGSFIAFSAAMEKQDYKNACIILTNTQSGMNLKSLWHNLAEKSLNGNDFIIAEISYAQFGDLSRARFIHKINKLIEKNGPNHYLVQSHIAMLQSNFKQAEYCFVDNDKIEAAIDMYKLLYKWNDLLDLVDLRMPNLSQKYQNEYYSYLIENKRYQEVALLKTNRGEIDEAVDLCIQDQKPNLAAQILLNNETKASHQLLSKVIDVLIKNNSFDYAGQIYEKLGNPENALDAYRKAHNFFKAVDMAKLSNPKLVLEIEREWGDFLVSQGRNDEASSHYIEAGEYQLALNSSLRAQQWRTAAEILQNISTPSLKDELRTQFLRVGRHFAGENDFHTAEDLFLAVDAHSELVELYLLKGKVDEGIKYAKRKLKPDDLNKIFIKGAKTHEKKASTREIAENIYLAIQRPELAIDMYQKYNDSENALRLSSKFGSDKKQLSSMAAQAERDENFELAESCYLRAGEWEKALFMYRQEKRWPDAMRIAKNYGNPTSEIQVAINWMKEIGGSAGIQKIQQLNLIEPVLLYCCENAMLDIASLIFDNCKKIKQSVLQEAHIKYGCAVEAQNKFDEAERHYILADQQREAVEMYISNKMWDDAQRIANQYGITDIPITPPKTYKKKETKSGNLSILKLAMKFEEEKKYDDAISTYLRVTADDCGSENRYDQVLERIVKLAVNYRQNQLQEIVQTVAQTLISMGRHASLGKILEGIEAYADAFEIYKMANMWDDAKRLSAFLEPNEQKQFERDYEKYLASKSDTEGLIGMGQADLALQILADKGEWNNCLSMAKNEGEHYLEKYTMLYAQKLLDENRFDDAINVLADFSPSATSGNIQAYLSLCQLSIYSVPSYDTILPSFFSLRKMLFKLLRTMDSQLKGFQALQRFTRGLHLLCQVSDLEAFNLIEMASFAAQSALRYSDVIPADFLFFKAGTLLKKLNQFGPAILFLNTFIDIDEVIKSGDVSNSNQIDHIPYQETDIPTSFCLRKNHSIKSDIEQETNDWILEQTVSRNVSSELPMVPCINCGRLIYRGNMSCHFCKQLFTFSHITGCPVTNPTKCTVCGAVSNRDEWGLYISKAGRCPCCDSPQIASA